MEQIGLYTQETPFSTENAGTSEWCIARRNNRQYFVKKFHSPVYPSKSIGLPEKMYNAGVAEFKVALASRRYLYQQLRETCQSGICVVPIEVINYQFHICTIADYVVGNISPEQICKLSEWQRLILMRTLTLALMEVHNAGVVHSDMKPENVLISQDEKGNCRLRLIDFDGGFFESNPPADPEEVVGDPAFFAPEAYMLSIDEDIRLDHRIDIFSLGIILHYFWSGSFPAISSGQTIAECLLSDGRVTFDEAIPPAIQQLIRKMISVKPEDRPALKSVYDLLGIQAGLYSPGIIKLQSDQKPEAHEAGERIREADVRVDHRTESGELLKSEAIKIPYGTRKLVDAGDDIEGYYLISLRTKEVAVDWDGGCESPITFTYVKKEAESTGSFKKIMYCAAAAAGMLIAYWVIMYSLSMGAYESGDYSKARKYMDLTPFFSLLNKSVYDQNEQMLVSHSESESSFLSTSSEESYGFSSVETDRGSVIVRWTDPEQNAPYSVSYQYIGDSKIEYPWYWAGTNEEDSITYTKSFTIDGLIPGKTYQFEVTDRNGKSIKNVHTLPSPRDFFESYSDSDFGEAFLGVDIVPAVKAYDQADEEAETISSLDASLIVSNMGSEEFGFQYSINCLELDQSYTYYTQIFVTAPNGYIGCLLSHDIEYKAGYGGVYWSFLGSEMFEMVYDKFASIPSGTWTVDLYLDGMHVNTSYFPIG